MPQTKWPLRDRTNRLRGIADPSRTLEAAERRNATAEPQDIDEALAVDHMARSLAHDLLPEIAAKSF
jgi:hypothetical protein